MAEEEKNEETENEQPEAEADAPAGDAPAEEPIAEAEDQPAADPAEPDAPAEDSVGDDVSEGDDSGEEAGAAGDAAGRDVEPEDLHPKAVRKRTRSQAPAEARPQRSVEERAAERAERRRQAAVSRRRHRQSRRAKRGEPGTGTPPAERELANPKVRQGMVLSSKGDKTITVKVELVGRHRRYEKVVRRSRTLHAHDESNQASEGDVVRIVETRPLSKTKRWRLDEILERAR
jgi:small subunit ribosomal protein S17